MSRDENAVQGPQTATLTQVTDLIRSLAEEDGYTPWADADGVGATAPDARFTVTDAGDGRVNVWRALPEGDELPDEQYILPEAGRLARLFQEWGAAERTARDASHEEDILRMRAQGMIAGPAQDAGTREYGWRWRDRLTAILLLPHGTALCRRYVGVSEKAPTGWAWEDHGRLRRHDADVLLDLALEGIIPTTMAAPVIDADRREQLRRSALAAAVDQALEEAGYGPAWERELLRTDDDPAAGALPEDAYPVLLPMGEQWGIGLTGPDGAGRLDPEVTGTMPVWTAAPAARAWIAATLGEAAAERADLAGLDR